MPDVLDDVEAALAKARVRLETAQKEVSELRARRDQARFDERVERHVRQRLGVEIEAAVLDLATWPRHQEVVTLLDTLDRKEAMVMVLRYGLGHRPPLTYKAIGALIPKAPGTPRSTERIRQIWAKSLRKLRHPSRSVLLHELTYVDDDRVRLLCWDLIGGAPSMHGLENRKTERDRILRQVRRTLEPRKGFFAYDEDEGEDECAR
jgi:hypothetical protein